MTQTVKVLFVCMGNICRSPLAHGYFETLVKGRGLSGIIEVDSAGTHAYHVGEKPDPRSQEVAIRHGIDLSNQRGRKVCENDFEYYDYILAMDRDNLSILHQRSPTEYHSKIELFMNYANDRTVSEVPDPYYGGSKGFDNVYSLIESASTGLLENIQKRYLS